MKQKQNIRLLLILGLMLISLGGWLLHVRIHHPFEAPPNLIPFITGIISIVVVPFMFFSKKTMAYAYVINGMFVIIGAITMGNFSLMKLPVHVTFSTIIFGTLLADIFILLTNFVLGKALFELEMFHAIDAPSRHGRLFRYPNMGWWWVHLFTLTFAYSMGHILWK